jgi:hypothetical protein
MKGEMSGAAAGHFTEVARSAGTEETEQKKKGGEGMGNRRNGGQKKRETIGTEKRGTENRGNGE